MEISGFINIKVDEDKVSFESDMSVIEMNFWLDHVKNLLVTGQASTKEDWCKPHSAFTISVNSL